MSDSAQPLPSTLSSTGEKEPDRGASSVCLRVVHPASLSLTLPLGSFELELGRERIDHATVSRRHLSLVWDPEVDRYRVRDLRSRNGSSVDGEKLTRIGASISVGSIVRAGDVLMVVEPIAEDFSGDDGASREAIPGEAHATRVLRSRIARAARDSAPVLLIGETGTGKDHIAAELQRLSGRGDGGTLLLDEIGDVPLELQPKLLRTIQEAERVIATTQRDLSAAVEEGSFRRDLYARLSIGEVRVPALRERRADLLDWIRRLYERKHGVSLEIGPNAAEALLTARWPTNLHGLERLVHELALAPGKELTRAHLPAWIFEAPARAEPPLRVPEERRAVPTQEEFEAVFLRLGRSVRATAKHFGRDRRQIYRWVKAYGLEAPDD